MVIILAQLQLGWVRSRRSRQKVVGNPQVSFSFGIRVVSKPTFSKRLKMYKKLEKVSKKISQTSDYFVWKLSYSTILFGFDLSKRFKTAPISEMLLFANRSYPMQDVSIAICRRFAEKCKNPLCLGGGFTSDLGTHEATTTKPVEILRLYGVYLPRTQLVTNLYFSRSTLQIPIKTAGSFGF